MDDVHWCWSECCDQGPHGCVCGNDCLPEGSDTPEMQEGFVRESKCGRLDS